jgi:hypothetical protein
VRSARWSSEMWLLPYSTGDSSTRSPRRSGMLDSAIPQARVALSMIAISSGCAFSSAASASWARATASWARSAASYAPTVLSSARCRVMASVTARGARLAPALFRWTTWAAPGVSARALARSNSIGSVTRLRPASARDASELRSRERSARTRSAVPRQPAR